MKTPPQSKTAKQKRNSVDTAWKVIIAGLFVVVLIGMIVMLWTANSTGESAPVQTFSLNENGDLILPISELHEEFQYVDYGGVHDLLLWQDSDGTFYTAFNSCQECNSRGNARYTYNNGLLTCQSCGNQIEVQSMRSESWGGCQPIAIPVEYRADTETEVVIPAAVFTYSDAMFQLWDSGDFSMTLESFNGNN